MKKTQLDEQKRIKAQNEAIETLKKRHPVKSQGMTQERTFTSKEMKEMYLRAKDIKGFPKRTGMLKKYQGMLPGEHIRVR